MSECVVRMEMPYSCMECRFNVDGWCYALSEYEGQPSDVHYLTRPEWCPIICQLPEEHGRLVDKDEMLKKIENYHRYMTIGRESDPRCIIEDSLTIVPAERRPKHDGL